MLRSASTRGCLPPPSTSCPHAPHGQETAAVRLMLIAAVVPMDLERIRRSECVLSPAGFLASSLPILVPDTPALASLQFKSE